MPVCLFENGSIINTFVILVGNVFNYWKFRNLFIFIFHSPYLTATRSTLVLAADCGFSILKCCDCISFDEKPKFFGFYERKIEIHHLVAPIMQVRWISCLWKLWHHNAPQYLLFGTEIGFDTKQCDKFRIFFLYLHILFVFAVYDCFFCRMWSSLSK